MYDPICLTMQHFGPNKEILTTIKEKYEYVIRQACRGLHTWQKREGKSGRTYRTPVDNASQAEVYEYWHPMQPE